MHWRTTILLLPVAFNAPSPHRPDNNETGLWSGKGRVDRCRLKLRPVTRLAHLIHSTKLLRLLGLAIDELQDLLSALGIQVILL